MGYFSKFKRIAYDIEGNGVKQSLVNLTSNVAISSKLIDNVSFYSYVNVHDGERMEQLSYRIYGTVDFYWTFILVNKNLKNIWNDWPKSNAQIDEYVSFKYPGTAVLINPMDLYRTEYYNSSDMVAKFKVGDEVYSGNPITKKAVVINIHANQGYIELEPLHYCSNISNPDASINPQSSRDNCIQVGGKWKQCDLNSDTAAVLSSSVTIDSITASAIVDHKFAPHHFIDVDTSNIVSSVAAVNKTPITNLEYESWINDTNRKIRVIKPQYIHDIAKEFNKEISKA